MKKKRISVLAGLAFLTVSCGANEGVLKSGKETPPPVDVAPAKPPIERELDAMRTAGFTHIYVVKRKDGAKLELDDRGSIKMGTVDADRRVASEDGMAVVIGSKVALAPDKLASLTKSFAVESYTTSPPATTNTNSESNK